MSAPSRNVCVFPGFKSSGLSCVVKKLRVSDTSVMIYSSKRRKPRSIQLRPHSCENLKSWNGFLIIISQNFKEYNSSSYIEHISFNFLNNTKPYLRFFFTLYSFFCFSFIFNIFFAFFFSFSLSWNSTLLLQVHPPFPFPKLCLFYSLRLTPPTLHRLFTLLPGAPSDDVSCETTGRSIPMLHHKISLLKDFVFKKYISLRNDRMLFVVII
jgi:hypothetical protein